MSSAILDVLDPSEAPVPADGHEAESGPTPQDDRTDDAVDATDPQDARAAREPAERVGPDTGAPAADGFGDAPAAGVRPAPARLRCATCGTLILADAPAHDPQAAASVATPDHADDERADTPAAVATWRVPVHAGLPDPVDPFAARPCPGAGAVADPQAEALAAAGAVPAPAPVLLPPGLHWRDRPFSHGPA